MFPVCVVAVLDQDDGPIDGIDEPQAEVDFSQLTYLAMGDSITYGLNTYGSESQVAKPYPVLVRELLGMEKVYNYGISGSTLVSIEDTRDPFCERYASMPNDADIVSVMGGVNDYWLGYADIGTLDSTDTTTIYGALNVLVSGLKEKYPDAYIFFMTPYKWGNDPGVNAKGYSLADICTAIKNVCAKYGVDVLDMYTYGQIEVDFQNPQCDKLHPTQEFFENYTAPQIATFIKENYK
jgi:lysophospholipase L1-like esterase